MTTSPIHRRLYIFRHGQTDWNAEGRIQGHLDIPLNDLGRTQAARIAPRLKFLKMEAVLSSDLSRAFETAKITADHCEAEVFTDPGLREIFFGEAQGLTKTEIEARFGIAISNKMRHTPLSEMDILHIGCENGEQVTLRALEAIRKFCRETSFVTIGVSTHGGVLRRLLQHAAGDGVFPPPVPNGILYPFFYDVIQDRLGLIHVTPI